MYILTMVTKVVLLFCGQALLAQCISSQCIGAGYGTTDSLAWGPSPWNHPCFTEVPITASWVSEHCTATPFATAKWAAPFTPTASNGGGFIITSSSSIPVTGLSMTSENGYEGPIAVSGAIPFLGAVALEGALPTAGTGAIAYTCGNGDVVILSEDVNTYAGSYGYTPLGSDAGIPGYGHFNRGCGCGAL